MVIVPSWGSSPLTRGKHDEVAVDGSRGGLIPAHAGKTYRYRQTKRLSGAHPRSRGENRRTSGSSACRSGSSPLTRGKLGPSGTEPQRVRLIPAHAGKTQRGLDASLRAGAHPRSRGENLRLYGLGALNEGSSPLTRGKLVTLPRLADEQGLIPAHAGKTGCQVLRLGRRRAHPRSRGENGVAGAKRCVTPGSSPLTRGKRGELLPRGGGRGLIPAHAGKTCSRRRTGQRQRAHPRSRGENAGRHCRSRSRAGSSPLTRGKRGHPGLASDDPGLIPAHAGKTPDRLVPALLARAHPRSRGENAGMPSGTARTTGSSPLTRGKRHHQRRVGSPRGLIPAHAGKTSPSTRAGIASRAHPRSRGENG